MKQKVLYYSDEWEKIDGKTTGQRENRAEN